MGKEGPLLHMGASFAANIGDKGFLFGLFKMRQKSDEAFYMNHDTRELVAVGAVSGISAALKAPVSNGGGLRCGIYTGRCAPSTAGRWVGGWSGSRPGCRAGCSSVSYGECSPLGSTLSGGLQPKSGGLQYPLAP